ncbi:ribokinase [Paenibacillus antibioticophila]|uniref:ribokinase n=1 Tax=Paenibacillus antibioticophila TaxID=1274374 RepID=UPI0005CB691E|nr:ribokinase [Paenibacillus antibioticophila]
MIGTQGPNIVVIGSINMDIVIETPFLPEKGETIMGSEMRLLPGGKGANQAVAAARLGMDTSFIGAVGKDRFGEQMLQELNQHSIVQSLTVMPEEKTGVASIWIHDQDNRIVVVPGANGKITWPDIEARKSYIDRADVVLLQLEIPPDTVVECIKYAYGKGKKVILNPAPAHPLPEEIYPLLYTLTPNRQELSILAGAPEILTANDFTVLHMAMQKMIDKGLPSIMVTLGADGVVYMNASGHTFHIPGMKMDVTDTTGAGDCFNAALAVSVARGWSMKQAAEYAVAASALAVTKFGAQNGMPEAAEVEQLMERAY